MMFEFFLMSADDKNWNSSFLNVSILINVLIIILSIILTAFSFFLYRSMTNCKYK